MSLEDWLIGHEKDWSYPGALLEVDSALSAGRLGLVVLRVSDDQHSGDALTLQLDLVWLLHI